MSIKFNTCKNKIEKANSKGKGSYFMQRFKAKFGSPEETSEIGLQHSLFGVRYENSFDLYSVGSFKDQSIPQDVQDQRYTPWLVNEFRTSKLWSFITLSIATQRWKRVSKRV